MRRFSQHLRGHHVRLQLDHAVSGSVRASSPCEFGTKKEWKTHGPLDPQSHAMHSVNDARLGPNGHVHCTSPLTCWRNTQRISCLLPCADKTSCTWSGKRKSSFLFAAVHYAKKPVDATCPVMDNSDSNLWHHATTCIKHHYTQHS